MRSRIIIHALSLAVGIVGFSVTVQAELPAFIENNQSKEELVTTENELEFATKLHSEYNKHFSEEYERTRDYVGSKKTAYDSALKALSIDGSKIEIEKHFRTLLEYSDTRDVQVIAFKSLTIAGVLEEESLRVIERVVTHTDIPLDLLELIFKRSYAITGERDIKFPVSGKKKYFKLLAGKISDGTGATAGNGNEFLQVGGELISEVPDKEKEEYINNVIKVYSLMPKDIQIINSTDFTYIALIEDVKLKFDHLFVKEVLKLSQKINESDGVDA
ncbi:MAG: hypothetical protein PF495_21440, partial [Spirochaetales bacterium]|nr:hypothetical protein [Spirochaetales bacterium]